MRGKERQNMDLNYESWSNIYAGYPSSSRIIIIVSGWVYGIPELHRNTYKENKSGGKHPCTECIYICSGCVNFSHKTLFITQRRCICHKIQAAAVSGVVSGRQGFHSQMFYLMESFFLCKLDIDPNPTL